MMDVNAALSTVLDGLTLADMVERSDNERIKRQNVVDFSI
jgi:DNA-binding IscR family transcriptional regulator